MSANLSADKGFVRFDFPAKLPNTGRAHSRSDAMAKIPSGLVGYLYGPLELVRGNAFLGFDHHVGRQEPFPEGQVGIMKDGPARYRKLESALVAIVLVAVLNLRNAIALATWAGYRVRPTDFLKVFAALAFAAEFLNKIDQVEFLFRFWFRSLSHGR
jgi:hypothetical protein